ncbi:MAG: ribonuclease III [Gammaproteobacteria bacterium]|nr:ribonuclease III [Gammaproteobacteria bacterium]
MEDVKKLYKVIDYEFNDVSLLEQALTHRSHQHQNNERIEFLGDSIVNFIIAEALFTQHQKAHEGELSRLRANLVCGDSLAEIAKEFNLGDYLRLGTGEMRSGGFRRPSILADAVEGIIGAIYLDADWLTCQRVVMRWFAQRLKTIDADKLNAKDPKTQLQEYLQAHKFLLPTYEVIHITGKQHQQTFHLECKVADLDHIAQGTAASRRKAEQIAAHAFLQWLIHE